MDATFTVRAGDWQFPLAVSSQVGAETRQRSVGDAATSQCASPVVNNFADRFRDVIGLNAPKSLENLRPAAVVVWVTFNQASDGMDRLSQAQTVA